VLHPEALLLVYDQEAEVLRDDVLLQEAVGAYQDVHAAGGHRLQDGPLLGLRAEAAQHFDRNGVACHPLAKRVEVLLREHGRRDEDDHLLAGLDGLERRPQRDLRLAEAHVSADQPVHRAGALHVALGLLDGAHLARRFGEGEGGLELALPVRVRGEGEPGLRLAARLDAQELGGQVDGGPLHRPAGLLPSAGADPPELRLRAPEPDVAADQVRFLERDVERHAVVELDRDHLAQPLGRLQLREAPVERDPVLQVDDEVALDELGEVEQLVHLGDRDARPPRGRAAPRPLAAEDLGLGDKDKAARGAGHRERGAPPGRDPEALV
jgi:hypothetical protein